MCTFMCGMRAASTSTGSCCSETGCAVNDDDRRRYESVKRELASQRWESSGDYSEAKSDVVAEIMRHAQAWARSS